MPGSERIPKDVLALIPARYVEHHCIVPLAADGGGLLVAHPFETTEQELEELGLLLGIAVRGEPCDAEALAALIHLNYGIGAPAIESLLRAQSGHSNPPTPDTLRTLTQDLGDFTDDAAIVSFVNHLIQRAYADGATDIHIEPFEGTLRVRARIDGFLHTLQVPSEVHRFQDAIVSRLKVMAGLDIAERRLPQDGRIRARIEREDLDLRLSILPTPHGETVDIRLLANTAILRGLESLGFESNDITTIQGLLRRPHGVVLVTGPTGSGKTTTLYSFLHALNEVRRKIIAIEDPIEYKLDGITQIQVHPKIGLGFARGLRSMLRHDPDVMMVGEIRDQETAETVVRVALTGHLVFSTVHTNDAPSTPARLMDMGIEPYLVASSVECVIAQRLVRLLCRHCAKPTPTRPTATALGITPHGLQLVAEREPPAFASARGCEACRFTGYRGRTAIFELLPITGRIRDLIMHRASANELADEARREGFWPLRWKGLALAARGTTSIEEVLSVTMAEDIPAPSMRPAHDAPGLTRQAHSPGPAELLREDGAA